MSASILVLGGNRFFGKHLVSALIKKDHKPFLFNRQNVDDGFGASVERIKGDRDNAEDLTAAAQSRKWDFVFDQICFTATQALASCEIFENNVGRYIVTSSQSVYNLGSNLKEEAFYPLNHKYSKVADRFKEYAEAKRQMEAVFYSQKKFPVTTVRFPIVLGVDDYTKRLIWHIDRLKEGKGIYFPNSEAKMGFVDSVDAGNSLAALATVDWNFPINICSPEAISIKDIMTLIEEKAGKKIKFDKTEGADNPSPFGIEGDWYMNVDQMKKLGLPVRSLGSWLPKLVSDLI